MFKPFTKKPGGKEDPRKGQAMAIAMDYKNKRKAPPTPKKKSAFDAL